MTDAAGLTHGFVYRIENGHYQSIDDPDGIGSTIVNGINDEGQLVGFFGTNPVNTGFVAAREDEPNVQLFHASSDRISSGCSFFFAPAFLSRKD